MGKHYTCDKFLTIKAINVEVLDNQPSNPEHRAILRAIQSADIPNKLAVASYYKQNAIDNLDRIINQRLNDLREKWNHGFQQPETNNIWIYDTGIIFPDHNTADAKQVLNLIASSVSLACSAPVHITIKYAYAYRRPEYSVKRCAFTKTGKHKVYTTTYQSMFMGWEGRGEISTVVNAELDKLRDYFTKAA